MILGYAPKSGSLEEKCFIDKLRKELIGIVNQLNAQVTVMDISEWILMGIMKLTEGIVIKKLTL